MKESREEKKVSTVVGESNGGNFFVNYTIV